MLLNIYTFVEARSGVTDLLPVGFWGSSWTGVVNGEEVTDVSDLTEEAVSKGGFLFLFIVNSLGCIIIYIIQINTIIFIIKLKYNETFIIWNYLEIKKK